MSTFVDFDNPQKDKLLSFTVVFENVKECGDCPYCDADHEYCKQSKSYRIYFENRKGLTNSCPMVAKEGEK